MIEQDEVLSILLKTEILESASSISVVVSEAKGM
jgi:hypothetical protein